MRTTYKAIQKDAIFYTTSSIIERIPIFTELAFFRILTNSFEYSRSNKNLKIYAYVVMDNHFHAIVSAPNITNIMRDVKRHTAQKIIAEIKLRKISWLENQLSYWKKSFKKDSRYQIWQEGFHPQQINGETMLRQKIEYLHQNPVKRGLVLNADDWRFSSARNYAGLDFEIEIDMI